MENVFAALKGKVFGVLTEIDVKATLENDVAPEVDVKLPRKAEE